MLTLIKMSSPGFSKQFRTIEDATNELQSYICDHCFNEVKCELQQHNLAWSKLTILEKLGELLFTPCGAEFTIDDPTNMITGYNHEHEDSN